MSTVDIRARTSEVDETRGTTPPPRARRYLLPPLAATIERRLLISYRLDADVAQSLLPDGLRPHLVDGSAVSGICLLRLGSFRPAFIRSEVGWGAENAAHRIAVQWDEPGSAEPRSGVYIPIRHSASRVPVLAGGRLFPGVHRHARFDVQESSHRLQVGLSAPDVEVRADVEVVPDAAWSSSLFADVSAASDFYRAGAVGWSPSHGSARRPVFDGLELKTDAWAVSAGRVRSLRSSFFDALPAGSAEPDSVLVMRDVPLRWGVVGGRQSRTRAMKASKAA